LAYLLLSSTDARAFFTDVKYFSSIGIMYENLTRTTDTYSGEASLMGTAQSFPIFFGASLGGTGFGAGVWRPRIGYTPLPRKSDDGSAKIEFLIISLPYTVPIGNTALDYTLGTSYVRQTFKPEGGTVQLTNGGNPATFYEADFEQTANFMTFDFGLGYNFMPYRVGADLFVLSPLSDKRSYHMSFNLTYFF